ncbi:MAG: signal peptidase I [Acidimicrobiales bacterium]|nr:signal peptidase I [Acidimicrobiales bacterium]
MTDPTPLDQPSGVDAPETVQVDAADTRSRAARSYRSLIEWAAVIVGALVVALLVKVFLIQAFYIPSESMLPTLMVRDRVLVNKLDADVSSIDRGDVIVFDRPGGPGADGISELIKRVIALPGETVEGADGRVKIDGEFIEEDYLPEGATTSTFGPETVPIGHVWVMGDNRNFSDDSRRFKFIPEEDIVGTAFVIIWPPGDISML